ncbi:hypothetical protein [Hahella sp. KA22]|uniref:hypothetical protein n=1 Tax=Hahella sp. KA22 TaxID=1628392 RepID=UPI0013E34B67|nr:hypothetical protein [Hahella sp. KA22]
MPKFVVERHAPVGIGPQALNNNAYYVGFTPNDLNPLDIIARQIIATKFSGMHDPSNIVLQAMRDVETVACAVVGTGTLLVAYNYGHGNSTDNANHIDFAARSALQSLHAEGFTNVTQYHVLHVSKNRKKSFHAEMNIIEHCGNNNLPIQGAVIGVSKPCCGKCAEVLNTFRVDYSLYSAPPIGQWERPNTVMVPTSPRSPF